MHAALHLLLHHAYAVLFGWVLIEQGGLPVPSIPLMLAAGTLSAAHELHIAYALPAIMLACLIACWKPCASSRWKRPPAS